MLEMLTLDSCLVDLKMCVDLTTLKQSLGTEKNRKFRHLRELYPDINIKLLYRKDYHRLLAKDPFRPLAQEKTPGIEQVLLSTNQIQKLGAELGR
jgi:hypoxanthine phosphoribosyltransferase